MKRPLLKSALVLGLIFLGVQGFIKVIKPLYVTAPAAGESRTAPVSVTPLKFTALNNERIALEKYKGQVVILNFFATWCPPCRKEIPHFIELRNTYKKLVIIGIAVDQEPGLLPDFIQQMQINSPIALQTPDMPKLLGNFSSIPTTFIIDKNGYVVETVVGYQDKEFWESRIKPLF